MAIHLPASDSPLNLARFRDGRPRICSRATNVHVHVHVHVHIYDAWKSHGCSGTCEPCNLLTDDGGTKTGAYLTRGSVHVTRAYRYRTRRNTQRDAHASKRMHTRETHTHIRAHIYTYVHTCRDHEASIYGASLALTVSSMFDLYERAVEPDDIRFGDILGASARNIDFISTPRNETPR